MLNLLVQISLSIFLNHFMLFATVCVIVGWLLIHFDGSGHYSLPKLTCLTYLEIATLRKGYRGVIQVALFNLWRHDLIATSGRGHSVKVRQRQLTLERQPESKIEEIVYQFVHTTKKPIQFFVDKSLRLRLNKPLQSINQKLEQLHLKRTPIQFKQAWLVFGLVLFIVLSLGGIKLYLEIMAGHSVELLTVFLIIIMIVIFSLLLPSQQTQLGHRYYQELMKEDPSTLEPVFNIAIFGVKVPDDSAIFTYFAQIFDKPVSPGASDGGCGGG